jgi:hypothetical protein
MGAGAIPLGGPIQTSVMPYKDAGSPAAQGQVWNEVTGQWQSPTSTTPGAMPSDNTLTGGLGSALGTTSTAGATPAAQTGNYITRTAPNGSTYQVFQATDANGNPIAPTPMPMQGVVPQGGAGMATIGNANTATLGTGQTASPYINSTNPYIQAAQATTMGNLYGAQAATQANRINQNTPYGSLNYTQSVDANGNPTWTANQQLSQPLQDLTNTSLQGLQQSLQNPMYGINPGQTYSDAIMQRLAPQLAQQSESNTAALANQGIVPGTQAYENAMRTFQQGQNDLRTSAQIQGMQTGLSAQSLQNQQAANIKALGSPGYVNPYSQAAVAGPDYTGAYTTSQAAQIAAQNAANAKAANTQNGLFGLGSAALLGGGGIGSLGTNGTGGTGLLGLGGSAYNALTGNNGMNLLNNSTNSIDYMNNIGATPSSMYDQAMSSNDYLNNLYGNLGIF